MILINIATPKRDISKLSSYNDAALQVLMSVCPCVCLSVSKLKSCLILRFPRVPIGCPWLRRFPIVRQVPKVNQGSKALHELACSSMTLNAVLWPCIQFHELGCSYISFQFKDTRNSARRLLGSSRRQQLLLGGICRQLALIEICQQMYTQLKVYRQSYCIQLSKIPPNGNS